MSDPFNEEQLIEHAETDPEAFGQLYELYVDKIYTYIYYRLGNSQDAEDLTAKVFYRALNHIPHYNHKGVPFAAWLYRIAHNLVVNWRRDHQRRDEMYQKAQDLVYLSNSEGFEKAADNSKYQIGETPEFSKGGMIPGIGFNDAVMNFAFSNDEGAISEVMSVSGGVVVGKIILVREEGVRPFEEVRDIVRPAVLRAKKLERTKEQAAEFFQKLSLSSDLVGPGRPGPRIVAQKTGPFKAGDSPAGVGRDLAFIGVAAVLNVGEISRPFEGARGYYILKLTSKTAFDSTAFSVQRSSLFDKLLQEKRNALSTDWLRSLRERADIEDNRDSFLSVSILPL